MVKTETDKLISVAQAARSLGLSKMTIYRWARSEPAKIASKDVAGFLFIPQSEVERLQKERAANLPVAALPPEKVKNER